MEIAFEFVIKVQVKLRRYLLNLIIVILYAFTAFKLFGCLIEIKFISAQKFVSLKGLDDVKGNGNLLKAYQIYHCGYSSA